MLKIDKETFLETKTLVALEFEVLDYRTGENKIIRILGIVTSISEFDITFATKTQEQVIDKEKIKLIMVTHYPRDKEKKLTDTGGCKKDA